MITYLKTGKDVQLIKAPPQPSRRKRDVSSSLDEDEDDNHFFSEDDYEYHELYYDYHYDSDRAKRSSDDAIIKPFPVNGITEDDARKECEKLLLHSTAAKACGGLDLSVKNNMGDCMLDIQVGNLKGLVRD